jgi:hydroxypyruvate reductase
VASNSSTRLAAAGEAARRGYPVWRHDDEVTGDALEAGRRLASEIMQGPMGLHVWGGETTVRLPSHPGRGGRCQSLALSAAMQLEGHQHVYLLAAGTDGSDGPGEDAGALVDGATLSRGELSGYAAGHCLSMADAGRFLEGSGDLIHTGPTGTNVMDIMLGLKTD